MESDKFKSHLPYCSFFRLYGCRGSVEVGGAKMFGQISASAALLQISELPR
jgi:hypothetical protein